MSQAEPAVTREVQGPLVVPATFLRLDRPELDGTNLVVRAVNPRLRERRRLDHAAPLAYLYERSPSDEPDTDITLNAGRYDEVNLVWSFSGDVEGIIGLTEPMSSAGDPPAGSKGEEA